MIGTRADCPAAGITEVTVNTRDLNDRATLTTPTDDVVIGGDGADLLRAGTRRRHPARPSRAPTRSRAAMTNDILDGGTEADVLNGGAGSDLATYAARTEGLKISINDVANDGSALDANADDVRSDVERVTGGSAKDALTGNAQDNTLTGGAGTDTLRAVGGTDRLIGGDGNDSLDGGIGADDCAATPALGDRASIPRAWLASVSTSTTSPTTARSGEGDNVHSDVEDITGGQGSDFLVGDADSNHLLGGAGVDDLLGEGGPDAL